MIELKDDVGLVNEIVRKAFWDILYHEGQLVKSHKAVAYARAVLIRGNYKFSLEEALESYEENEGDNSNSADDWIKQIVGSPVSSVGYHERSIAEGYCKLAAAKILILRGKYTEIDLEKIKSEVVAKLAK